MRIKFYSFCVIGVLFISIAPTIFSEAQPQANPTQTLIKNANINTDCNGYAEYLPQGYDPNGSTTFPLLVYFPGISQSGDGDTQLSSLLDINPLKYIAQDINNHLSSFTVNSNTYRFVMITPQWIQPIATRYPTIDEMNSVINFAIEKYKVDRSRIYLMGISSGGGSVWHYASDSSFYANRIAAIVPFSGTDTPSHAKAAVLKNANMPIWAFHNSDDGEVNVYYTTGWGDSIKYVNGGSYYSPAPKFTIWTTTDPTDHNSWDDKPVGGTGPIIGTYTESGLNIYQWMLQYTRPVSGTNLSPTAYGGPNRSIVAPNDTVHFNAYARDLDSYTLTYSWSKISGPGSPSFSSTNTTSTVVSGLSVGTYVFRFSVSDGTNITNSDVTITVKPAGSLTTIEAENFSNSNHITTNSSASRSGGQFIAYKDQYARTNYNINTNGGAFNFSFSVQSPYTKTLQIIVGGSVLGTVNVPATGSNWQTVSVNGISIPSGSQTLQIAPTGANWFPGSNPDSLSMDYLTFVSPSVLPIRYVYFNSSCTADGVKLMWQTAVEQNSREFSIQGSSDGVNWIEVGRVAAAGQSSGARDYSYVDRNGSSSANSLYRIVEYDYSGEESISSVVRSSCSSVRGSEVSLYPNPTTGQSSLSLRLEQATRVSIQVLDSKGALMQQNQVLLPQGNTTLPLDMSSYAKGVYSITVRYGGEMKTMKLIKE